MILFALQLDLSMTLGDLVVAASVVTTLVGAYFAMKHQLANMHRDLMALIDRVDEHDDVLQDHGEAIAVLSNGRFGRRRSDKRRRRLLAEDPA